MRRQANRSNHSNRPGPNADAQLGRGVTIFDMFKREVDQIGARGDPIVMRLVKLLMVDPSSREVRRLLEQRLMPYRIRHITRPDYFAENLPDRQDAFAGTIELAELENGIKWRIDPAQVLNTHWLNVGPTGSGKSNVSLRLADLIMSEGILVAWYDNRKKEGRRLLKKHKSVVVLNPTTLKITPRPPVNVPIGLWGTVLFELFAPLDLRLAGRQALTESYHRLCKKYRVEETGVWFSFLDLLEDLMSRPQRSWDRNAGYLQGAIQRLKALIDAFGEAAFNASEGYPDEVMSNCVSTVTELDASFDFASWADNYCEIRIYMYRHCNRHIEHRQRVSFFDEGSEIFSRRREESYDAPYTLTQTAYGRGRALKLGYVCNSLSADELCKSVIQNSATKCLLGPLGRGHDTRFMAECMGLSREQLTSIMRRGMDPGYAVIKDPRYGLPVEVRLLPTELNTYVSDDEVAQSVERGKHLLTWKPRMNPDGSCWTPDKDAPRKPARNPARKTAKRSADQTELMLLLLRVVAHLTCTLTEHREALAWSVAKFQRMVKQLLDAGFALLHEVRLGRARAKILEVTDAGYVKAGVDKPPRSGKGGVVHAFLQAQAVTHYTALGYDVAAERNGADVWAVKNDTGESIAVEIELHPDTPHVAVNAARDIKAGATRLVLAAETHAALEKIRTCVLADADLTGRADDMAFVLFSFFKG